MQTPAEAVINRRPAHARGSFAARLFGYDIFISFALGAPPRGTQSLASDLARRLRERDLAVFFSEDEAPPGSPLDATLLTALHRSRVLVVLVNRETLRDPRWVRVEVEEFRRHRPESPVIPINIDGALQDADLAQETQAWLPFQGHIWLDADSAAADAGLAGEALVERLVIAPRRVRANVAWRRLVGGSMALLAALTTAFGVTAWVAVGQRNEAVALQVIAQGAGTDGDLDTKLLATAEALRRYPARMGARLNALVQLARAADQRALLRLDFDPAGWAASPDGRLLVLSGWAGEQALVSLDDWRLLDQAAPPRAQRLRNFPGLVLGPDGSTLISDRDGAWTLRHVQGDRLQAEVALRPPSEIANVLPQRLSPDSQHLLGASYFGIWIWTLGDTTATRLADGAHDCLAFSADGSQVLIGDGTGTVQIRLVNGRPTERTRTPTGPTYASSDDCTRVAVVEQEPPHKGRVTIRDSLTGAHLSELDGAADASRAATFSRDGRFIALANSKVLGLWSVETGEAVWTHALQTRVMGTPFVSRGQEWVAVETGDPPIEPRRLRVHNAQTGELVLDVLAGHPIDDVVFGLHGDSALTLGPGSGERRGEAVPVWWLGHRDRLHDGAALVPVQSAGFSAAGDTLILAPKGGGADEGRDPLTGARRALPDPDRDLLKRAAAAWIHPRHSAAMVLAPDGYTLAIGDGKGEVALVDIRDSGSAGRVLHRHPSSVTALAFDPRSEWVASAAFESDGHVIAQRADGGGPPVLVVRGIGRVQRLHFIDNARWLRVDDTVWDVERRAPVADFSVQSNRLKHWDIAPTGDAVVWLFDDGSLRLGRWSTSALVAEACSLVPRNLGCDEWRRLYGTEPYSRTCANWQAPRCGVGDR
jgi:WD40 repeat protein